MYFFRILQPTTPSGKVASTPWTRRPSTDVPLDPASCRRVCGGTLMVWSHHQRPWDRMSLPRRPRPLPRRSKPLPRHTRQTSLRRRPRSLRRRPRPLRRRPRPLRRRPRPLRRRPRALPRHIPVFLLLRVGPVLFAGSRLRALRALRMQFALRK